MAKKTRIVVKRFSQEAHFKKTKKLTQEVRAYDKIHGNYTFPASMGLRMAKLDIEWWSHYIKDEATRKKFIDTANKLVEKGKPYKRGMDVPRGVAIEHLYYTIALGYTDEQYRKHLASYD